MVNRADIVSEARKWLGTPYHHQGRVLGHGVDCLGVVVGVAKALGLSNVDFNDYGRMPEGDRLMAELRKHAGREMPTDQADVGDILVMRFLGKPRHVAIKTDFGIIHSYTHARKVIEHSFDDRWKKICVCAFEFPGVICN